VATVVSKLFNIVQPERAYFGQKDIQQCTVLKALVRDLLFPIDLRVCPTVRDHDGLALSSRNEYLQPHQRHEALMLYRALKAGVDHCFLHPSAAPPDILETARNDFAKSLREAEGRATLDYLEFVHPMTLQPLTGEDSAKGGVLVGAFRLKGPEVTVRLIDNMILE
jgi:pantoate--beta-alanine ligase